MGELGWAATYAVIASMRFWAAAALGGENWPAQAERHVVPGFERR